MSETPSIFDAKWWLEKAAGVAGAYPQAAEWVARRAGQGDKIDLVKFLYEEDKDLPAKIARIRQDPGMAKFYDEAFAATQKEIEGKIPAEWRSAAASAGIPVAALEKRIKENGAEKIAYAITASVQEEIKSSYWYGGKAISDVWQETKQNNWKEPEKSFFEDPLGWISTMVSNVIGMVKGLWQSTSREDLTERGKAYATQDAAARSEEIVGKVGQRLAVEMNMPTSFAVEMMLGVHERIHKEANPAFTLSEKGKTTLKARYVTQLDAAKKAAATPAPAAPSPAPVVTADAAAREQVQGTPELGLTGGAEVVAPAAPVAPAKPKPAPVATKPDSAPAETSGWLSRKAEFDYPEFGKQDLSKYIQDPGMLSGLGLTLSAIASGGEERLTQVLKSYIPDASFFYDNAGGLVIETKGERFYWNRPGPSAQDAADPVMEIIKFAPVGKIGALAAAGKGLAGRALAYAGVGAAWGVATDSAASVVAGQPDVDVGQAILGGITMASFPLGGAALKAIPTDQLGAMGKKIIRGLALTREEMKVLEQAGVAPAVIEKAATPWLRTMQERAAAAGIAGAATVAASTVPAAAGDPIPHADVDPSRAVRPGKTPTVSDEMSLPLMP